MKQVYSYKTVLLFLITLFISSCASMMGIPEVAEFQVQPNSKIGVLVEAGKHPVHTHIGTTVFNNFVKTYEDQTWPLKELVEANLNDSLANGNLFSVVNLDKEGISFEDVSGLIVYKSGEWVVNETKTEIFNKLTKDLGLDAVVVAKEQEVLAYLECTGGPCTSFTTKSSGMFTRSFLGIKSYWSVAALDTNIFILHTPTNAAGCKSFRKQEELRSVIIRNGFKPKNLKTITPDEWSQVKVGIDKYVDDMSGIIPGLLRHGCTTT